MTKEYIKEAYEKLRKRLGHKPSEAKFYGETNVTYYYVVKFFRTFSNLVKEMGDVPESFLKVGKSEDEFMIPYGNMIKSLGGIPSTADWLHNNGKPFVSSYRKKFKLIKWEDMVTIFYNYACGRPEWKEVIALIPHINDSKIKFQEKESEESYVYLMLDKKNSIYKIGISNTPEWREKTLQSEKPSIKLIAAKKFVNRRIAANFEKALHDSYSHKRTRGEWFRLDQEDIDEIKTTLDN